MDSHPCYSYVICIQTYLRSIHRFKYLRNTKNHIRGESGIERRSKPLNGDKSEGEHRMSESVVYVGSKPILAYVTAIMTSFSKNPEKVILRARGRAISSAVDAAEVTRTRFLSNLTSEISIGTEEMQGEEGRTRNVSTIEIILRKSPEAIEPSGS